MPPLVGVKAPKKQWEKQKDIQLECDIENKQNIFGSVRKSTEFKWIHEDVHSPKRWTNDWLLLLVRLRFFIMALIITKKIQSYYVQLN